MKAVVIHAPYDLRVEDCSVQDPGPGEIRVRIRAGGICGSDLHYFNHGGFGSVRLCEAMVLGHEVAGVVEALGEGVEDVALGDHVAVNPSQPCGVCPYCLEGLPNQCLDMRFYGSAMRRPHVQGAFREQLVCKATQAVLLPKALAFAEAAFAEPLAVCLHAVSLAGSLVGKRVLVSGVGPIGALCVLAARHAGAEQVVATDLLDEPLAIVAAHGADRTHNVARDPDSLSSYKAGKGYFDVVLEASGSQAGLTTAAEVTRPRGVIVQIGLGGDLTAPMGLIVSREICLRGSFRFHAEFAWAARAIASGAIDVRPLLTAVLPIAEAEAAFRLAGDRTRSMKVQLSF